MYYASESISLHHGDALTVACELPSESADCIVTSPPYYGLRDYGIEGQYGSEPALEDYVDRLDKLFGELRRVLADDGTVWLNLGDSFGKDKQLLGVPWRVALSLQDSGWILRNAVVWQKPNAMPESVRDRLSVRYEHVFLFVKSKRYHFDLDPIRQPHSPETVARARRARKTPYAPPGQPPGRRKETTPNPLGANPGDVWSIAAQPFKGAHFATFPSELPRRCILSGCKPNGTVLDPFHGSGTTGVVAVELGRKYVGIDLNSDFLDLSLAHPKRFGNPT